MVAYVIVCLMCVDCFVLGYLIADMRARRRASGSPPPPVFTLTSRGIWHQHGATYSGGFQFDRDTWRSVGGSGLAGDALRELNSFGGPTGYGDLEDGNRGNGLLPYAGSDD